MRLRSESEFFLTKYFRDHQFVRVQPPIITSSDCEGGGEVFLVSAGPQPPSSNQHEHFFRSPKFLTVSSQLHLEAFVHEHARVWTLSPTFRAEKSDTPRHISEFWMLEAEMWTERLDDVMQTVEDALQHLIRNLLGTELLKELAFAKRKMDPLDIGDNHNLETLEERWYGLMRLPWPRITYTEAIKRLQEATWSREISFQHEVSWEGGLLLEHEKWLAASIGQGSPVFVSDYPAHMKPFYMLPSPSDEEEDAHRERSTVACFDLLLPDGCEVVGGSLREHRYENLQLALSSRDLNATMAEYQEATERRPPSLSGKDNLEWYLDLRRYGSIPHGGFGLGFDRLLGFLSGVNSIKDVVGWPRYFGRCDG